MKKQYVAWIDSGEYGEAIAIKEGYDVPADMRLLHRIEADTWEEAQAVHHIKMGWNPYSPMGDPRECPNNCGAIFYPEGSGECPTCGKIC